MTSSGTTLFSPTLGDLTIEAYSRCQIRPTSLTADHMVQARQSAQFLLSEWTTKPSIPNLWKIALFQVPLYQGIASYAVPANVVAILDYYIRQFQVNAPISVAAAVFQTVTASPTVTVNWSNHGQVVGNQLGIPIPAAIGGGLLLQGFYQVASVLSASAFTITSPTAASGFSTNTAQLPQFTTASGATSVTVVLPNNGLAVGALFTVQAATTVGGLTLQGTYPVASITDSQTFVITAPSNATSSATVTENGNKVQFQTQSGSDPIDRVIFPISRSEYSAQPDKFVQAFPTTVWWDRLINSTLTLWQVPDGNGPYVLNYYAMTQIQDAVLPNGVTMDLPYRFLDAFAAGLAARLARKYAPALVGDLRLEAQATWEAVSKQDSEDVPLFIVPGIGGYYR